MVLAHDIDAIAELKASTSTPVIASEMLVTRYQYRHLLERRAADIVMVDPTWAGGITESRKIGVLAESFGLPIAMHDCTGPFTLLAGLHLALSAPNAIYQEHVRAYVRGWFDDARATPPWRSWTGTSCRRSPRASERRCGPRCSSVRTCASRPRAWATRDAPDRRTLRPSAAHGIPSIGCQPRPCSEDAP